LFTVASAQAAVSITGVADKSKNTNTVTYTVVADTVPGTTTTATLNGVPTTVGSAVVLTDVRYHELYAESRDGGGALVSSQLVLLHYHQQRPRGKRGWNPIPHALQDRAGRAVRFRRQDFQSDRALCLPGRDARANGLQARG
jgi:hypothetical protein